MIEWFDKTPGNEIGRSQDDPTMLLLGLDIPEWIFVPEETGYGGRYRCTEKVMRRCPLHDHLVPHYLLERTPVAVAECMESGQFLWYKRHETDQESS